jgi:FkbH-like protein
MKVMSQAAALRTALGRLSTDPSYSAYVSLSNFVHTLTPESAGLPQLKIAISRNFTIDTLLPVLEAEVVRAGFFPSIFLGEFDNVPQDFLNPRSGLYASQSDFILLAQWLEALAPQFATRFVSLSPAAATAEIDRILGEIRSWITAVREQSAAPILLNNFVLPPFPTLGILDAQIDISQTGSILRLNTGLRDMARESADVYLVDLMGLSARMGYEKAFDDRYWHMGRAPLGRPALVALAKEYVKFVRALRGRALKCLVLDCDNTLWGGVIGEDGMSGIKLGSTYPGSCYKAFQREILNLKDRGVILALCTKNNEEDVLDALRNHPDMLLREEHFAVWEINWADKVTNLRKIAQTLNIGLDAVVFADDNRFECDFVRENLPEIEVLHLGDDPSAFPRLLASTGYFDTLTFSREDSLRTEMYRADAHRYELQRSSTSLQDYLTHLQLVATVGRAGDLTIPRIAQLTQKTNQFNLTMRRYSESEIRSLAATRTEVFYLKLRDRVSDLGLVGVAIVKYESTSAEIDTFLLSCRALGRGAEEVLLAHCLQSVAAAGVDVVSARYRPTGKNRQVAGFYSRCGFSKVSETSEESVWQFHLGDNVLDYPDWIHVEIAPCKETYAV